MELEVGAINVKVEINERINKLSPYPSCDDVTAKGSWIIRNLPYHL